MAYPSVQWSKDAYKPAGIGAKLTKDGESVESASGYVDQAFQIGTSPRKYADEDLKKAANVCADRGMQALVINCQMELAEREIRKKEKEQGK